MIILLRLSGFIFNCGGLSCTGKTTGTGPSQISIDFRLDMEGEVYSYEPDYEPETILIGDSIYLEVLSLVGKSEVSKEVLRLVENR